MNPRRAARDWLREGRAWMSQARHWHHDWGVVRKAGRGPTVILVHGVYATPGVFRPLRLRLQDELGATTVTTGYLTGVGIEELATRLSRLLAAEESPAPIHLVGHSLGGIVARRCVQRPGRDARIASSVSLGAPFRGTPRARLVPGPAARDLEPTAALLRTIAQGGGEADGIPHLSIAAADDLLVTLPCFPDFGERVELAGVGHNGLLFDPRVAELLVGWIRRVEAEGGPR